MKLPKVAEKGQFLLGRELLAGAASIVLGRAQDHESFAPICGLPARQIRQRETARSAPRRPEIKQYNLTAQIRQLLWLLLDPLIHYELRQRSFCRRQAMVKKLLHINIRIQSKQSCRRISVKMSGRQLDR